MNWVMRKPFYPSAPSDEKGLEYFYIDRRALADFRRGPLGGHFDGFAAGLKQNGYANKTACMILGACCVFNAFLIERGIKDLTAISDALVGEFLAAYLRDVRSTCLRYRPRDNCLAQPMKRTYRPRSQTSVVRGECLYGESGCCDVTQ